ncbi:hypothetical protein KUTeg_022230 [Tegillarca granosa]|uniref:Helicase ATP-binding domain-containing protein n=1 Tax=Tegillarca granosa TaxID=220873 RepID=A0ABQ9E5M6_TEGGR|nr:hypothetical protein KUTeg_022230 [Tegillarca granosa]
MAEKENLLFSDIANFLHQKTAVNSVAKQEDIFISTRTDSGKSLCYQSALMVLKDAGVQKDPIIIVTTALISIMEEQVELLNGLGFSASYIGKDVSSDSDIEHGKISFIFSSPEHLLNNEKWRGVVRKFAEENRLRYFVVDEAHTVLQWGTAKNKETQAFREWFGNIGELRSLAPNVPMMALTATANTAKRKKN